MDRDFLSSPRVVAASEDVVCARLLTYESADEADVLTGFFVGRSGALENTTFALVAPDGRTPLTRGGRSPRHVLGRSADDDALALLMDDAARRFPARAASRREPPLLPYLVDVRRGLNVAACDLLPLAVVVGGDATERAAIEATLRPLAWADARRGRLLYAPAASAEALRHVAGVSRTARLVVLQADEFGRDGVLLSQTDEASSAALAKALDQGLRLHRPAKKDARTLIAKGRRAGVHWTPEIPVTDPGERRAP
jgi:hypothetical protein